MTESSGAGQTALIEAEVREGTYGAKVAAIEPGGAEFIPLSERHGKPHNQFWTWVSPNMEFATIFVGFLGVWYFGESFWQTFLAIIAGSALGALSMGFLGARGPLFGVPQMIISRLGFGFIGNILPAGINAVVAGVGWFAVNSVSGAFALNALFHWNTKICLLIVVVLQIAVAFVGHNFVHVFERIAFPILVVIFIIASVFITSKTHDIGTSTGFHGGFGGWLVVFGAAFGYAAGWNPYASDYTRYLSPTSNRAAAGAWAGVGIFLSCVWLETIGAAAATITSPDTYGGNPTAGFVSHLPTGVADATLLAIALGAVCANALNVYSGSISFLAIGFNVPLGLRRAIIALLFGILGFLLALSGLHDAGEKYNNFLLVIAYWIGPWLGVVFTDQLLRRGKSVRGLLFDKNHNPIAGFLAMLVAMVVSIYYFSDQTEYVGQVAKHSNWKWGDLTPEVGFLLAAVLYALLFFLQRGKKHEDALLPSEVSPISAPPAD